MNDYKELITELYAGIPLLLKTRPKTAEVFKKCLAAIEQLVKERDTAVKNMETATPTVDAVEVVRCKDCKYSTPDIMSEDYIACWERNTVMPNDGFCSYGKRKEVSE